ncbi:MAG: ABC transporter permease [Candidatus Kerfeldbacteria bacterium]
MKTLKNLWQIAKKDLLEFRRDRLRLVTFFIMPMFMMVLTGYIFPNQNTLKDIPIGIANLDNGAVSQQLEEAISGLSLSGETSAFALTTYDSADAIKDGISSQDISGGIAIPADFSEKIARNEQVEVQIIEDQSNPQISQIVNQVLSNIVSGMSDQISVQTVTGLIGATATPDTQPSLSPVAVLKPIQSKIVGIIASNPNYFEFIAPGIMAMVVMTAVLTGLAASISREKETGTLDGILISPINRLSIILGKAVAQSVRGLIQGGIVLLLAFLLFGVTIHGSILLVILLLLLGVFSFVGLGILVSAIATEQETATQLLFMFQFPMLFLSGTFFPILMMPKFMQTIAYFIPLTYAIEALRKVMVLGAGVRSIQTEIIVLATFGVVTLIIAVPAFKRVITR